ncbi:MAG: TonB-dependent receptor [Opitutaceae bacterium]|nr:TonB-dependent receptor [Opitutaceae bacterium]
MKHTPNTKRSASVKWAALGLAVALGGTAGAQQVNPVVAAESAPQTVRMDEFIVTGSNIPSAGDTLAAPVQTIDPSAIARTGVDANVLDIIRKSAPQFSGNSNIGTNNGNIESGSTNGGSSISLRNLSTLVLVNGRRVANAPVAASGGTSFVDVNSIPVAAIERIEVLSDGASAIYGSDAVGGVVNIILRSNYSGAEFGGRYGFTRNEGEYRERSAYGVVGGKIESWGTNISASYEWGKTDPIYNIERSFSRPSFGTTNFAGVVQLGAYDGDRFVADSSQYYFLDPTLDAPKTGSTLPEQGYTIGPVRSSTILRLFDLSRYVTQLLGTEKRLATLAFDQRLAPNVKLFGDVMYGRTDTQSQLNAQPLSVSLRGSDPANVLGRDVSVRNRFVTNPRTYRAITDLWHVVSGIRGTVAESWTWEGAVNYNRSTQAFRNGGLIRSASRAEAVKNGSLKLFSRTQDPQVLTNLFGEAKGDYTSEMIVYDFKLAGADVFKLPGGSVGTAFGVEYRTESLEATSDIDSQSATFAYDSGTTIDPFDKDFDVASAYAEVRIPLVGEGNRIPGVYAATLTLAGRHERYSNTSDPTVPKISVTYQPFNDTLLFRGTFGKSFSAPTLYQINAPPSTGFTPDLPLFDGEQAFLRSTSLGALKPSNTRTFTGGVVWTPGSSGNFLLSLDYFDIRQSDVLSTLGTDGVIQQWLDDVNIKGAGSAYAKYVHIGDYDGPTISNPGQLVSLGASNTYIDIPSYTNIGEQSVKGYDFKLQYKASVGVGKLAVESSATYYTEYNTDTFPGLIPATRNAGRITALNGTISRWRSYSTINYEVNDWDVTLGHTYYPPTKDSGWSEDYVADGYNEEIPSYSVFDVSTSYTFNPSKRWMNAIRVTIGCNNIGNRMPTKVATYDGLSNADIGEFSPNGRFYYVSVNYKF